MQANTQEWSFSVTKPEQPFQWENEASWRNQRGGGGEGAGPHRSVFKPLGLVGRIQA